MQSIKQVIMKRDGISSADADELIDIARAEVAEAAEANDLELAYEIVADMFGLEPDYLVELID